LNADLWPKLRTRPAVEVTADDLLAVLNAKLRDGAPVAANRVRALVSRIYTVGAEQHVVPPTANPAIGVKKPTNSTDRIVATRHCRTACPDADESVSRAVGAGAPPSRPH
jgi:hypothetical protein